MPPSSITGVPPRPGLLSCFIHERLLDQLHLSTIPATFRASSVIRLMQAFSAKATTFLVGLERRLIAKQIGVSEKL